MCITLQQLSLLYDSTKALSCANLCGCFDFFNRLLRLGHRTEPFAKCVMRPNLQSVLPLFNFLHAVNGEVVVAKTGMGSSAALITSLVGCLLSTFNVVKLPSSVIDITTSSSTSSTDSSSNTANTESHAAVRSGMRIVHNLAQVCHAAAQGKIGSGFDVSSAVYGSHVYTRFSPQIIAPILSAAARDNSAIAKLHKIVAHTEWDCIREPTALPTTFRLLMGDVQGGSSTPAMVSCSLDIYLCEYSCQMWLAIL
jgi:phosphomevalonate kinase